MGILMYCHPGHLRLGLGVSMSCSAAWSGIYVNKLIDQKFVLKLSVEYGDANASNTQISTLLSLSIYVMYVHST